MHIRKMKFEDYKEVRGIIAQVHNLHFNNRPDLYKDGDPLNKEYFESLSNNKDSILLVAENENKKVIGICIATQKEVADSPVHNERKYICIENICVDEKHRKEGIGKRLYNEIARKAMDLKVDSIELTVFGFNKNAISFYENIGMSIKNIKYEQKINT